MITSRLCSMRGRCSLGSMPEHLGVGGELARSDAEHHPAPGEVVEQHHPVGQDQRVVVGERRHPGAEAGGAWCAGTRRR